MQIIPVIDLKGGQVVHAAGGDRNCYRPVHYRSSLCDSSEITDVVTRFLKLYPFQTFYIADLDAIDGNGNHDEAIDDLLSQYPNREFWVDNGSSYKVVSKATRPGNCKPVIGTESQRLPVSLQKTDLILSLDFKHNQALGHPGWQESPELWPDTVVVMTLDLVGSNKGPDFEKLSKLCQDHLDKRFVAAGGVRDINDLTQLKAIGVAGVLLASALHNGSLDTKTLQKF
ncbi:MULTISPECIES: HisA/HisF-related TIM barrel protein [Methylomonas]|uniref:Histidine biosynthesis protein n=2 Tax=Methylomonas TaxID=416 RepID=A0A126T966_9GAMM|nr:MULTISPECIES: HisA/HisF-related TIM barrel protein [Methylomonas]AMK78617.1 histidine biosynthesis protein [Methylomonas denitrificans]OAI03618.1 histidine biosynthesis protein [Methylomonas methanica]TCV83630.1 phosphoribosylformimino-5-aminoimidazole carboxamide ribotide isomerase [Methylomonas methanica]